jgi:acyl-CoA reductase-like NAD-dependent aldehyde dehydrogenase
VTEERRTIRIAGGPVLSVVPNGDDAGAIRIADDSGYGPSGSVRTAEVERGPGREPGREGLEGSLDRNTISVTAA